VTFPEPYRTRPARRNDLDALVQLFEARDDADVGFIDQAREEILADWAFPTFDFDRDSVVAESSDGSIAAYGLVLALDPSVQMFGMGKVHPAHERRGLGAALVDEAERSASARLRPGVSAPFRTGVPQTDVAAIDLLVGRSYRHARSFWNMQRALPAHEIVTNMPAGITMRIGSADDEPLVHRLLDEAFRHHFGYEPMTFEERQREYLGVPGYDPSLVVLAFADDEPAGASVNLASDEGIGWVGEIGVLSAFRRRGVATALLTRSFAELAARDHHEVRLGVDTENTTGATHLYDSVGMTVRRRWDLFEKQMSGSEDSGRREP